MAKNRLSLINYEGDCLYAVKSDTESDGIQIVVYDQYDSLCEIYDTVEQFLDWIDGNAEYGIVDSKGKEWFFEKEHKDAKPSFKKIYAFLKNDETI